MDGRLDSNRTVRFWPVPAHSLRRSSWRRAELVGQHQHSGRWLPEPWSQHWHTESRIQCAAELDTSFEHELDLDRRVVDFQER